MWTCKDIAKETGRNNWLLEEKPVRITRFQSLRFKPSLVVLQFINNDLNLEIRSVLFAVFTNFCGFLQKSLHSNSKLDEKKKLFLVVFVSLFSWC